MTFVSRSRGLALLALALLTPSTAFALKFSNSFTEFELPPGWTCQLDELTWTCQTTDDSIQGDAVMVMAAKKKGDNDSISGIQTYLWRPRQIKSETGQEISSKPNYVKTTEINGQVWVDSLHINSELDGYYTRYIATIHSDLMLLITYSIEKSKYDSYVPQFDALVRSVKVFKVGDNMPPPPRPLPPPDRLAPGIAGISQPAVFDKSLTASKDAPVGKAPSNAQAEGGGSLLLLLLLGGGGFFIYKKKKAQQQQPPS